MVALGSSEVFGKQTANKIPNRFLNEVEYPAELEVDSRAGLVPPLVHPVGSLLGHSFMSFSGGR